MPTMADVARSAGVSVATVSHVLNETRPVLPHTRQAVLDAIDELGYTPNTLARSLVTSRTRSIGLAVSAISNPYFTEILQGVEAGALEHGYSLLLADPHDDPVHERKVVQLLHERRVDGMIVAPSAEPHELVSYLRRHDVPTVFLDRLVDSPEDDTPRFDQVSADNADRRPNWSPISPGSAIGVSPWSRACPGLSTTTRADHRATGTASPPPGSPTTNVWWCTATPRRPAANGPPRRSLSLAAPPTALVTANNVMTIGALRALRERGLSVPDDMALCCFDDFAWADLFTPRLTAIAQPRREIGAAGGPAAPGPPRRTGPARPHRAAPLRLRPPHLVRLRRARAGAAPAQPERGIDPVIVVAGEALIDLVPLGTGALAGLQPALRRAAPTTRPWRSAASAPPPPSAPASRATPSARRSWTDCGEAGVDVSGDSAAPSRPPSPSPRSTRTVRPPTPSTSRAPPTGCSRLPAELPGRRGRCPSAPARSSWNRVRAPTRSCCGPRPRRACSPRWTRTSGPG